MPERCGKSERTGTEWKVQEYVMETDEQYPRKMAFEVFGSERIANFNIKQGEVLTVSFDIDATEFNGRWYNRIRAWKVERNAQPQPDAQPAPATYATEPPAPAAPQQTLFKPQGNADDLPF